MSKLSNRVASRWIQAAVSGPNACPTCKGTGFVNLGDCPDCRGTGYAEGRVETGPTVEELAEELKREALADKSKLHINSIYKSSLLANSLSYEPDEELSPEEIEFRKRAPNFSQDDWGELTDILYRTYVKWGGV